MASELKFLIDNLDRGQPLNPEDFGITITEDDSIGARVTSFDNELIFGGDVFTYLYNKLSTSGYCELVKCSVQYLCTSGTWEKLVDGYIIATECNFLLDRCQVKTKLYDETFSTKINNNKGIPFSMNLASSKNGTAITPPTKKRLRLFNPANGVAITPDSRCYTVYDTFTHLVNCMSDGLVDFHSDFFFIDLTKLPQLNTFAYTQGNVIRGLISQDIVATFETLYNALRFKLNLGMGFEKQSNGRPLLRIEPMSYFQQSTPSSNLYDQSDIEMKFDVSRLYAAVNFGSTPMLEDFECDGGDTACSFVQTPFRGFRDETFGFIGQCNTSNILRLKTDEIVFDTNVIEDVVRFNNQNYDNNAFVIQSDAAASSILIASDADPYSIGGFVYNDLFRNESVSANWISGYPNSLQSFLSAFDPTLTQFNARATVDTQCWDIDDGVWTSYNDFTGNYLSFPNEISDVGNNFNGTTYVVPFTGLYTFVLVVQFDAVFTTGNKLSKAVIRHQTTNDVDIASYEGTVVTSTTASFAQTLVTAQFVCNAGDKIKADASGQLSAAGPPAQQCVLFQWVDIPSGTTFRTTFSGSGIPLLPSELQPVDINDVQTYLYKFKRPLSMAEINAITSETSKPILLGRKDDALAVSPTYIKNIQIESVMRKSAQFELRSNKLLP
jgi:hypothetical protein